MQMGTTKFEKHYQSFQVTTSEREGLSFGMLKLGGQAAEDLTEALLQKIADIAHAIAMDDAVERQKTVKQLLARQSN